MYMKHTSKVLYIDYLKQKYFKLSSVKAYSYI